MTLESERLLSISERIGRTHLRQRLHLQLHHAAEVFGHGRAMLNFDSARPLNLLLKALLRLSGLYGRGNRNFLDIQIRHNSVCLPHLPTGFEGFTILQLSDLHLDLDPNITPAIIERLGRVEYDLCVITGDFRNSHSGDYQPCLAEMSKIVPHLKAPVYAILGNHDFIEMVPALEAMGLRVLLNETVELQRQGHCMYLSGLDDPYFYETDNMEKVCQTIPEGAAAILLSHSPGTYRKAAAAGFDFMLSGHTHGGQICLPGGIPILRIGNCPAHMLNGAWEYAQMRGYTSPGTGGCGVPVRFFCPPEVTVHRLSRPS